MKKAWILGCCLLLAGCIGGGFSKEASFYELVCLTPAADVSSEKTAFTVGVKEVILPGYLDRPQMVTIKDDLVGRDISEMNRWTEPPAALIQRVLACDLGGRLSKAIVRPVSLSGEFDYVVSVDVARFEGQLGKEAVLEALWQVEMKNGKTVQERSVLKAPLGSDYADFAHVQSRLISSLADKIAARIQKR